MAFDVLSFVDSSAYDRYFAAAIRNGNTPLSREAYAAWRSEVTASAKVAQAAKRINAGTATHIDTHAFAEGCGEAASRALQRVLTPSAVGETMSKELAAVTVDPVLRANYGAVTQAGADIQTRLYRKARFGFSAQTPEMSVERLDGLIEKLCAGEFVDTRSFLGEPIINFTEHVADELVLRNAAFQTSAGFEPYVMRILAPGCCDWCAEFAGRYPYSEQPKGLWRRHQYCRCVMDYRPENIVSRDVLVGESADGARTKKWVVY